MWRGNATIAWSQQVPISVCIFWIHASCRFKFQLKRRSESLHTLLILKTLGKISAHTDLISWLSSHSWFWCYNFYIMNSWFIINIASYRVVTVSRVDNIKKEAPTRTHAVINSTVSQVFSLCVSFYKFYQLAD